MSKSFNGSLFLDYAILFSLFFVVLVACLYLRLSPETSEVLAFSTLFGFLLTRRVLKNRRKAKATPSRKAPSNARPVRIRVARNAQAAA